MAGLLVRLWAFARSSPWRTLAILLALLNVKNLPFVWHLRFVRSFFWQLYRRRPRKLTYNDLFKPVITTTLRSPLAECDYNMHKSNSTYFSDLDMARTQLVSTLLRDGIRGLNKNTRGAGTVVNMDTATSSGKHFIAMGAVSCHFKREIRPYTPYEIWTRVLAWDRKWIYLVSHFVVPGTARPRSYALQPWKDAKISTGEAKQPDDEERFRKSVYATSVAKYVVKKGRLTIAPTQVLENTGLLPRKPESSSPDSTHADESEAVTAGPDEWTWERIEAERQRGLVMAEHFAALDGLHEEFLSSRNDVLGRFSDLL